MDLRLFAVNSRNVLEPIPAQPPDATWPSDGRVRWLYVQGVSYPLLIKLLAPLGVERTLLRGYGDAASASDFIERRSVVLFTHPLPFTWQESDDYAHFACFDRLLVTFQPLKRPGFDDWYARWLQGWPLASVSVAAMLHRIMESMAEVDKAAYFEMRRNAVSLSEDIKREGSAFDTQPLEDALSAIHRISTFFFDQRLIYAGLIGARTQAFSVAEEAERYRLASMAADDIITGTGQLQRRLENLHQQHLLEVQSLTDRNLRILTVLSAVFLPLTLISGIYGMNFENMPELDNEHAYLTTVAIMVFIAVSMSGFFYLKGWFK